MPNDIVIHSTQILPYKNNSQVGRTGRSRSRSLAGGPSGESQAVPTPPPSRATRFPVVEKCSPSLRIKSR